MDGVAEIIPSRLYFISSASPPSLSKGSQYFSIDEELEYQPFNKDFGPLHMGSTYKFCQALSDLLSNHPSSQIYHYTSLCEEKKANAACLMGAFQILVLKRSAIESWTILSELGEFKGFNDAGYLDCSFKVSILDCLNGLEKAVHLGWLNYEIFDVKEYEFYEQFENGDWNWIIPGKLLAFPCPSATTLDADGTRLWTPEDYGEVFKSRGVTAIVRLNTQTYDSGRFLFQGINHYDLFFPDGSCPTVELVQQFVRIVESEMCVAVHCKAGLGRTGTMIGCYAMKHFDISAAAFIGWARLMRPGSIIGPQQQFLKNIEPKCKTWGGWPVQVEHKAQLTRLEREIGRNGDAEQAARLLNAKKARQKRANSMKVPYVRTILYKNRKPDIN